MHLVRWKFKILLVLVLSVYSSAPAKADFFAASTCGDLQFKQSGLCAFVKWTDPNLVAMTPNSLTLRFWNASTGTQFGPFVDPKLNVFAKVSMPAMPMSNPPMKITRISPGVFILSNIFFTMGGEWDLEIDFRQGSGSPVVETATLPTFNVAEQSTRN